MASPHELGNLGPRLRTLRLARGLSLAEAASRGNVSKSALAGWEAGRRVPAGEALGVLLRALGVGERERSILLAAADPRYARVALADTSSGAPVHLGDALRAMRLRRGMGQTELARKATVNQSTVARWEAGDLVPEPAKLQVIFAELGARPEEIEALARFGTVRKDDAYERVRAVYKAPHALQELLWLALEGELWWRTEPEAASLLLRVRGRRVQWYHYAGRTAEAATLARHVVGAAAASDVDHISPAVFSMLQIARERDGSPLRYVRALERWRPRFRLPEVRVWAQAETALGLAAAGERTAIDLASRALLGAKDSGLAIEEVVYRRIDLAEVHLLLGDPDLALRAVEDDVTPEALLVRARATMATNVAPPASLMAAIRAAPDAHEPRIKCERRRAVERAAARFER